MYARDFELYIPALDIHGGGFFALLGPNGAGKSTLLRLLHFLEPARSGTIRFEGQTVDFPAPLALRRRITMVFQKPVMLAGSVRQNIAHGMRLRKQVNKPKIDALLDELDLCHLADKPARTLSAGEAQRVALARALAIHPDVLLLDEPTANLDPYNIRLIEHIIKRVTIEDQISVILVTHDVFQVRRLADRAAFLVGGRLVEVGTIDDLFERPVDPRTRAYLSGELVG